MTWGEIQIEALRKMFLNNDILKIEELSNYKKDKKYKIYLDAMPQACNEAINMILEVKPLVEIYELPFSNMDYIKLKKDIPNFKRIYDINYVGEHKPLYKIVGDNILSIKNWNDEEGKFLIYYEAFINRITTTTDPSTKIALDDQLCSLIPLYLAGELYKDDDLSMSTMYMNEFMTQLQNIEGKDFNYSPSSIEAVYSMYV